MRLNIIFKRRHVVSLIITIMIVLGILGGTINGNILSLNETIVGTPDESLKLCLNVLGMMAMWMGVMEIATASGLMELITKLLRPVVRILFPLASKDELASKYISANFCANILGLGAAATPYGIMAMKELQRIDREREGNPNKSVASNEMCTFLVINISSLQLIPMSIVAYRGQYGSVYPQAVVGPGLVASFAATLTAIVLSKLLSASKAGGLKR